MQVTDTNRRMVDELSTIRQLLILLVFVAALGSAAVCYMAAQLYGALTQLSQLF